MILALGSKQTHGSATNFIRLYPTPFLVRSQRGVKGAAGKGAGREGDLKLEVFNGWVETRPSSVSVALAGLVGVSQKTVR